VLYRKSIIPTAKIRNLILYFSYDTRDRVVLNNSRQTRYYCYGGGIDTELTVHTYTLIFRISCIEQDVYTV